MSRKDAICNINEVFGDRPYAKGSDTSWYAAHSIPAKRLSSLKRQILGYLRSLHPRGATDDELSTALNEYRYTVAPRRRWLVLAGLVWDAGQRRRGPRGRMQTVWRWKFDGSFIEPPNRRWKTPQAIVEKLTTLTYSVALKQIYQLHHPIKEGQVVPICAACSHVWPCDTNLILETARVRQKETVE